MVATSGHILVASDHHCYHLQSQASAHFQPRAHSSRLSWSPNKLSIYSLSMVQQSTSPPTVPLLFSVYLFQWLWDLVTVGVCLQSPCLSTAMSSGSGIQASSRHVTILYRDFFICQKKNLFVLLPFIFYVFLNCLCKQTNIGSRSVCVYFDVMQTVVYHYNTENRNGHHMQKFWEIFLNACF